MTTDTRVFTRDDAARWAVALAVLLVDLAWLYFSGRSVTHAGAIASATGIGMLAAISLTLTWIAGWPRVTATSRGMHYRRLALVAQGGALMVLLTSAMSVLSYLLISLAPPLVDERLVMLDGALGFHWPVVRSWVRAHPLISAILKLAYVSGGIQLVLVPMLAGLLGRAEYLREFLSMLILSCILLLLFAAPWPAAGAFVTFGVASPGELATVSHFSALRDGSLRVFDLGHMQGLISLPSYHTTLALVFVRAMRWTRTGFVLACMLNLVMIASTPTEGGHYLVDVIAGVGLWGLTVCMLRLFSRTTAAAMRTPVGPVQPA